MPLIACPDCQKQVSDRIAACIHCGAPLTPSSAPPSAGFPPVAPRTPEAPQKEELVWSGAPSHWAGFGGYLLGVLLLFLFGLGLLIILWQYLVIRTTKYAFTNQRLTVKRGILNRSTEEVELFRVKDTGLEEPILMRMVGCGHILVVPVDATAAAVVIGAVPHAEKVRNLLREQVNNARMRRGISTIEGI